MSSKNIVFNTKVKTRWLSTIFITIVTGFSMFMIGILFYGIRTTPSRFDEFIVPILVLNTFIFAFLNYISWQVYGREYLILSDSGVEVYNTGTWFSNRQVIPYEEIDNITQHNDDDISYTSEWWGIGGGNIRINYLGRHRKFGQDLTSKESKLLAQKIQSEFNLKTKSIS